MMVQRKLKFLCITSYFKGEEFLRSCKAQGNDVYLLTSKNLQDKAWPWESINEVFYADENESGRWNMDHIINWLAYTMRTLKFDKFISLDDFDVEKTARLREIFRMPGMGETTVRYFRDKLAMRLRAEESKIPVPAFVPVFNDAEISEYTARVQAPWALKPRGEASATGIKKIHSTEELWRELDKLGDQRYQYVLEKFTPGDVYHVDSLSFHGKVVFTRVSKYLATPFEVAHGGGIFRSLTVDLGSDDDLELRKLNAKLLEAFGMQYSASHSEYIKSSDTGQFYFLETSCRVGGAHLAEMVEVASGINLWREWAVLESSVVKGQEYVLPRVRMDYAGIVVSLAKFEHPDDSSFNDPEIQWKLKKDHHIGLIIKASNTSRILELLNDYSERIKNEFHASLPPPESHPY